VIAVPKLRTRQVVPTAQYPNFRDAGRMVDRPLLAVVSSLQRKHGESWASEAGLRRMICQDTGHMPGVGTIPKALARLEQQGIVDQVWLKPGGLLPDELGPCTYGTRLVVVRSIWRDKRVVRTRNRREGVTWRENVTSARQALEQLRTRIAPPPAVPADAREQEAARRRAEGAEKLAELAALWDAEKPIKPMRPPD